MKKNIVFLLSLVMVFMVSCSGIKPNILRMEESFIFSDYRVNDSHSDLRGIPRIFDDNGITIFLDRNEFEYNNIIFQDQALYFVDKVLYQIILSFKTVEYYERTLAELEKYYGRGIKLSMNSDDYLWITETKCIMLVKNVSSKVSIVAYSDYMLASIANGKNKKNNRSL